MMITLLKYNYECKIRAQFLWAFWVHTCKTKPLMHLPVKKVHDWFDILNVKLFFLTVKMNKRRFSIIFFQAPFPLVSCMSTLIITIPSCLHTPEHIYVYILQKNAYSISNNVIVVCNICMFMYYVILSEVFYAIFM